VKQLRDYIEGYGLLVIAFGVAPYFLLREFTSYASVFAVVLFLAAFLFMQFNRYGALFVMGPCMAFALCIAYVIVAAPLAAIFVSAYKLTSGANLSVSDFSINGSAFATATFAMASIALGAHVSWIFLSATKSTVAGKSLYEFEPEAIENYRAGGVNPSIAVATAIVFYLSMALLTGVLVFLCLASWSQISTTIFTSATVSRLEVALYVFDLSVKGLCLDIPEHFGLNFSSVQNNVSNYTFSIYTFAYRTFCTFVLIASITELFRVWAKTKKLRELTSSVPPDESPDKAPVEARGQQS
jgi:hypothetical protein